MAPTRIKICGITRPEDALAAIDAGADALGLVFYANSARAVTAMQAADIAAVVPPFVTLVSLFVNAEADTVADVVSRLPVGLIQFHGDEDAAFCASFERPWIKALRVRSDTDVATASRAYAGGSGILLDAWQEGVPGGTGKTFDWRLAVQEQSLPLVLAGGLTPENVGDAITRVKPWAVDVSGGVESTPGIKDSEKIKRFVAAVRAADRQRLED
ncbi:phosphoribosylanthranilate isomerase [Seongchinamella sediminis]|uniref:N-(5'-phosphoribosyl)anthranilate isomerase n=1 Tax=Seongchinamella sediminis TaxID=2283635 RepID=A0A3L7E0F5_9GAMM|nr:phosphoribosylanthranilate isomerase [Seongchinamella sediminis]RLQ22986.1 phosphoribosylanthranilate isomerase [Seongchinamella sediminis]